MKNNRRIIAWFLLVVSVIIMTSFIYLSITQLPKLLGSLQAAKFSKLEYSHSDSDPRLIASSPGRHYDFYTAEGDGATIVQSFIADLKKEGYSFTGMYCSERFTSFEENRLTGLTGHDYYSFEKPDKRFLYPHELSISMYTQTPFENNNINPPSDSIIGCERPDAKYLFEITEKPAGCVLPASTPKMCVT